jgi:lytic murein transglycosylase
MPLTRRDFALGVGCAALMPAAARAQGFDAWLRQFRRQAAGAGISQDTLDAAFAGVQRLPRVIANDRKQAEVARSLQEYVGTAASAARINGGTRAMRRYRSLLAEIERRFGVEKEVVVAIWGMESSFGGFRGSNPVISVLATLAHEGRRAELFRTELLAALQILQAGQITPARMQGSFAGAMGHTQFMPSTYLRHAVDFNGDGRRDIWGDDPTDALASAAALLKANGWQRGQPWAVEVTLPQGFDLALTGRVYPRSARDWRRLRVTLPGGARLPDHGRGALILPAGPRGPVFMIYDNFHVLKTYNYADSYVIGVGHLSDRLAGGGPIRAGYPRNPWGMTDAERVTLQKRLNAAGHGAGNPDGVIGEKGRAAIRSYEAATGQRVTGVPSRAMLRRMR